MRGRLVFWAAGLLLVAGCDTASGLPDHMVGMWGGPHVGAMFQGGLADVQFDCASATIDEPVYPAAEGAFVVKGTYRTGAPGPIKVGQFFKSQEATFAGKVTKGAKGAPRTMVLTIALEDGTPLGPFALTEGSPPQVTRCL